MLRVACGFFCGLLSVSFALAQHTQKLLSVSCTADKSSYTPQDDVNLTITLENHGDRTFYVYGLLAWGCCGISYRLTDAAGHAVYFSKPIIPLPPPPIDDKSQLVGLNHGHFYGRHELLELGRYDLRPGVYFIEVSYHSDYPEQDGFGLPLLTSDDGTFWSNKVEIQIRPMQETTSGKGRYK